MYSLSFYICTQPSKTQVRSMAKRGDNTKKCQCIFWRPPCPKQPENLELYLVLLVIPRLCVACWCWVGEGLICQKMALVLHGAHGRTGASLPIRAAYAPHLWLKPFPNPAGCWFIRITRTAFSLPGQSPGPRDTRLFLQ